MSFFFPHGWRARPEQSRPQHFADKIGASVQNHSCCYQKRDEGTHFNVYIVLLAGMEYLHCAGVLHGDLKTANVLLKSTGSDSRGFQCKVRSCSAFREQCLVHILKFPTYALTLMPHAIDPGSVMSDIAP